MIQLSPAPFNQRIGFHYFPDTVHYRQDDLETWAPILKDLGASWVTLQAPTGRAIPEAFLSGMKAAGIEPVLHFSALRLGPGMPPAEEFRLLARSYARWGIRYVAFFDRPNCRASWENGAWVQGDLVERFLDLFTPLATTALDEGLTPVFPPLEPGGDYWDLSFLRAALRGLQRRSCTRLLENLAFAADAWSGDKSLDWGMGGPERWPGLRPYCPPQPGGQDHKGFRIFDWYLSIAQAELAWRPPVLLLHAGTSLPERAGQTALAGQLQHAQRNLAIARCLAGEEGVADPVPPEVIACCFWLLATDPEDPAAGQAWLHPGDEALPVVGSFRQWAGYFMRQQADGVPVFIPPAVNIEIPVREIPVPAVQAPERVDTPWASTSVKAVGLLSILDQARDALQPDADDSQTPLWDIPEPAVEIPPAVPVVASAQSLASFLKSEPAGATAVQTVPAPGNGSAPGPVRRPISHYVLLPLYAWGAANWDLTLIEPLLQTSHPTIGFSLAEARHAERVTIVGGEGAISAEAIEMLRASGCQVERIMDDGTLVAT